MTSSSSKPLYPGNACIPCRRRKAKCNGVRPVCERCARLSSDCHFDPPKHQGRLSSISSASSLPKRPATTVPSVQSTVSPVASQNVLAMISNDAALAAWATKSRSRQVIPLYQHRVTEPHVRLVPPPIIVENYLEEGYGYLVNLQSIEASMRNWVQNYDPPTEISDLLIRLFLPHRFLLNFDFNDFKALLDTTGEKASPVQPCLLNAIYLAACWIGGGELWSYQELFHQRCRSYLDDSYRNTDRLSHWFWANLLLTFWYIARGLIYEARSTMKTVVEISTHYQLHASDPSAAAYALEILGESDPDAPQRLWNAIVFADSYLSECANQAPWIPFQYTANTEELLRLSTPSSIHPQAPSAIRATVRSLLLHIRVFKEENGRVGGAAPDQVNSVQHQTLCNLLERVASSIVSPKTTTDLLPGEEIATAHPTQLAAHIEIQAAIIYLYEQTNYEKAFRAATTIASVIASLGGPTGSFAVVHQAPSLARHIQLACEVLVRDLMIPRPSPTRPEEISRRPAVERGLYSLIAFLASMIMPEKGDGRFFMLPYALPGKHLGSTAISILDKN